MGVRRGLRQKGARGLTGDSPSSLIVVFGVTGELYDVVIAVGPACAGVLDPVGVCRGHPEESRGRRDELEARISSLETEYEELLGASDATLSPCCALTLHSFRMQRRPFMTRKSATSTSLSPWRSSR